MRPDQLENIGPTARAAAQCPTLTPEERLHLLPQRGWHIAIYFPRSEDPENDTVVFRAQRLGGDFSEQECLSLDEAVTFLETHCGR